MNDDKAKRLVREYVDEHVGAALPMERSRYDVFIVWKCKVLQNYKYLLGTNLHDDMYYELTYNGDLGEAYLDVYTRLENVVIDV